MSDFNSYPRYDDEEATIAFAFGLAAHGLMGSAFSEARGEQPASPALPAAGAMSGDIPRSYPSESEVL